MIQPSAAGAARLLLAGAGNPGANAAEPPAEVSAPFDPGSSSSLVHHLLLEPGWAAVGAVSPPAPRSGSSSQLVACVGSCSCLGANLQEISPRTTSCPYSFKLFFKACMIIRFGAINRQARLPQMRV